MRLAWEPKQFHVPLRDLLFMVFVATVGMAILCGAISAAWRGLQQVMR